MRWMCITSWWYARLLCMTGSSGILWCAGVPRVRRVSARAIEQPLARRGQGLAALFVRALAIGGQVSLHALDERGQRRFAVGCHRDVDFRITLLVLVIRLHEQIAGRDADELRAGFGDRSRRPAQLIAIGVDGAPEIRELEAEDHVGRAHELARAIAVVERMARREIQPLALIDDRRLQEFGEL